MLFSGDILYGGRIPLVGEADSKRWLDTTAKLLALKPKVMVPGHGGLSREPARDLTLTRDYIAYLRETLGKAVAEEVGRADSRRAYDNSNGLIKRAGFFRRRPFRSRRTQCLQVTLEKSDKR